MENDKRGLILSEGDQKGGVLPTTNDLTEKKREILFSGGGKTEPYFNQGKGRGEIDLPPGNISPEFEDRVKKKNSGHPNGWGKKKGISLRK